MTTLQQLLSQAIPATATVTHSNSNNTLGSNPAEDSDTPSDLPWAAVSNTNLESNLHEGRLHGRLHHDMTSSPTTPDFLSYSNRDSPVD